MFLGADDVEYMPPLRDATTASTGFFSSPEDLLAAAKQTDDYVTAMQQAIDAVKDWSGKNVPAGSAKQFRDFYAGWKNFYQNDFGSRLSVLAHWFTGDMQSRVANYQSQAATWGKKLRGWGVAVAGTPTPDGGGGGKNVMMWVGIGAVTLAGLFIVGKLIHTVALGGAALEEAEEEAMRLADQKQRKKHDRRVLSIT